MFDEEEELTFVDFLPDCQKPSGIFSHPEYDNFRVLVDRANTWLRSNAQWSIKTCESIAFRTKGDRIDPDKMIYLENGAGANWYIRGLRLWVKRCEEERLQQIGYRNLVPEQLSEGGIFSSAVYEDLDELIRRFNESVPTDPIPGRIINVVTQAVKLDSSGIPNVDSTSWHERERSLTTFLFIIRIFFEMTEAQYEEIGMTDFMPDLVSKSCITAFCRYEPFDRVVEKASDWCCSQSDLRIINVQSLDTKLKEGSGATRKMTYREYGSAATFYVRILRIVHTRSRPEAASLLRCKTFVPAQLTSSGWSGVITASSTMPQFEGLQDTRRRVSTWMKATGADVLNMETTAVRYNSGKEAKQNADVTFTYDPQNTNEFWIFVVRAYVTGAYSEPAETELPPVPEIERGWCSLL